jgi:hypothetical protein
MSGPATLENAAMNRLMLLLPLLSACALYAETAPPAPMPDLPSASLQLKWEDLKGLLDRIAATAGEKAGPPVPWQIMQATYRVEIAAEKTAKVDGTYRVSVLKEGWNFVPLLNTAVGIEHATCDGQPASLGQKEQAMGVLLMQPGEHTIEIGFYTPWTESEGVGTLEFGAVPAAVTQVHLSGPQPDAQLQAKDAVNTVVRRENGRLDADMLFHPVDKIALTWRLPAAAIPPAPAKEPPRITCQTGVLATVSERLMACQAQLQFDVLRGETNRFVVALPAKTNLLHVDGEGVEWAGAEEGDNQVVTLTLNHAIKDHYAVTMQYETALAEGASTASVPLPDVRETTRQNGFVAIATRGNMQVDAAAETLNLQRVDAADLPAALRALSVEPILHAFRYGEEKPLLALALRTLQDAPIRAAAIEDAQYESVLTQEGVVLTHATYRVRNHLQKFLQVELGPDTETLSAAVAGKSVRPAKSEENANALLLPLIKSDEPGSGVDAFVVELYYMHKLEPGKEWLGAWSLESPKVDLLANHVTWTLYLPEEQQVYREEGDMHPLTPAQAYPNMFGAAMPAPVPVAAPAEMLDRLQSLGYAKPEEKAKSQPEAPSQIMQRLGIQQAARAAGVVPVRFELPRTGRSHAFERTIVEANTPLHITLHTYGKNVSHAIYGAWIALSAL